MLYAVYNVISTPTVYGSMRYSRRISDDWYRIWVVPRCFVVDSFPLSVSTEFCEEVDWKVYTFVIVARSDWKRDQQNVGGVNVRPSTQCWPRLCLLLVVCNHLRPRTVRNRAHKKNGLEPCSADVLVPIGYYDDYDWIELPDCVQEAGELFLQVGLWQFNILIRLVCWQTVLPTLSLFILSCINTIPIFH
jgi:hypothetical protein